MKQLTKSEFNRNGRIYKSVTSPASDTDFTQISDIGVKDDTFSYSVDGENFIKLVDDALSNVSGNPVANSVITNEINNINGSISAQSGDISNLNTSVGNLQTDVSNLQTQIGDIDTLLTNLNTGGGV